MEAYVLEWLGFLGRWFHMIAGIAWIGASFYFIWLDGHLLPPRYEDEAKRLGRNRVVVAAAVAESGAAGVKDMGKVMALLRPRLAGRADMGKVSGLVKAKLGG